MAELSQSAHAWGIGTTGFSTINFNKDELTPEELEHARLTARVSFHELYRTALTMNRDKCSYKEAFLRNRRGSEIKS